MTDVTPYPKSSRSPKKRRGRARPDDPMRWRCEICNTNPATERHHKLRRSAGGTDEQANTLDLCGPDHARVHANPEWAYEHGYMTRRSA